MSEIFKRGRVDLQDEELEQKIDEMMQAEDDNHVPGREEADDGWADFHSSVTSLTQRVSDLEVTASVDRRKILRSEGVLKQTVRDHYDGSCTILAKKFTPCTTSAPGSASAAEPSWDAMRLVWAHV